MSIFKNNRHPFNALPGTLAGMLYENRDNLVLVGTIAAVARDMFIGGHVHPSALFVFPAREALRAIVWTGKGAIKHFSPSIAGNISTTTTEAMGYTKSAIVGAFASAGAALLGVAATSRNLTEAAIGGGLVLASYLFLKDKKNVEGGPHTLKELWGSYKEMWNHVDEGSGRRPRGGHTRRVIDMVKDTAAGLVPTLQPELEPIPSEREPIPAGIPGRRPMPTRRL